ncbi:MAG TPA: galactokinase [Terriglobales bacterium]|nr:galactokinase [Terriglobales bacterium]
MALTPGLQERFEERFGATPRIFRAPGRVNLIGEHTDYNDGFVMPVAIQFSCWVAASARPDRKLVIHSENLNETATVNLADARPSRNWSDYVAGAAAIPDRSGYRLQGANLLIHSEVPMGAGLSSSAAIEVSVALAMLSTSGYEVDRTQLARWCQQAEHEFPGMMCGIMDQFISCRAEAGRGLKLDCRTLAYEYVLLPQDVEIVICNTMVKHKLASGEYNTRRQQCETGVRVLAEVIPGLKALRDVSPAQLRENRKLLDPKVYRRCLHVVTENERVQRGAEMLNRNDVAGFGKLMDESHESLRRDFEVSCAELDKMIEIARDQKGVLGARMTGGGFGGCTVNLVGSECAHEFEDNVRENYRQAMGVVPEIYVCRASQGAEEVKLESAIEAGSRFR